MVAAIKPKDRRRLTSFYPIPRSGLQMWFAADRCGGPADTTEITTISDISGNGRNGDGSAGPPNFKVNVKAGKPSILFDGAGDRFNVDYTSLNGAMSAFIVFLENNQDAQNSLMEKYTAADGRNGFALRITSGTIRFGISDAAGFDQTCSSGSTIAQAWSVGSWLYDGVTTAEIRVNGTQVASTSAAKTMTNDAAEPIKIGTRPGAGAGYHDGYISEIILYNRLLSASEYKKVERYLGKKYAITVA